MKKLKNFRMKEVYLFVFCPTIKIDGVDREKSGQKNASFVKMLLHQLKKEKFDSDKSSWHNENVLFWRAEI